MKRNEILRELMYQKNITTAELVRITGIPYSTVKSILENGVEKSGYSNVCALCDALGITTDELEQLAGQKPRALRKKQLQLDTDDLSDEELKQMEHYLQFLRYLRE